MTVVCDWGGGDVSRCPQGSRGTNRAKDLVPRGLLELVMGAGHTEVTGGPLESLRTCLAPV